MRHDWYAETSPCRTCGKNRCLFTVEGFLKDSGGCVAWNYWAHTGWQNQQKQGMQAIQQRDLKQDAQKL
jgi:hypothetical protein